MNAPSENPRLLELLADEAAAGIDAREWLELQRMLTSDPKARETQLAFELAAAAAELAQGAGKIEAMPASLRAKIEAQAMSAIQTGSAVLAPAAAPAPLPMRIPPTPIADPRVSTGSGMSWAPWMLAAAAVALAVTAWWPRVGAPTAPSQGIAQLARQPKTMDIAWNAGPDPSCKDTGGHVVWNNESQQGFMKFTGLPVHDPGKEQYQLWIIDKTQAHPIDGGVFNVNAKGEVIIPIVAKLKVVDPAAFAVTIEKPGGVVVSEQKRVAAIAPVKQG